MSGVSTGNVLLLDGDRVMVNGGWTTLDEMREAAGEVRWITIGEVLRDMSFRLHLRRGLCYAAGLLRPPVLNKEGR